VLTSSKILGATEPGWCEVVVRSPAVLGLDGEALGWFVGAGEAVATADGKAG
jgi:hypothetical protein